MNESEEQQLRRALDTVAGEAGPSRTLDVQDGAGQRRRAVGRLALASGAVVALTVVAVVVGTAATHRVSGPASQPAVPAAGSPIAAPAGLPAAVSGGRLAAAANGLGGNLVDLRPPPSTLVPQVTALAAYASCLTDVHAHCATDVGPSMVFALVSTDTGGHVNADGSVTRVLNGSPTWVLTWTGLTCTRVSGGPPVAGPSQAAIGNPDSLDYPCIRRSLVDATTGKWISTIDSSR